MSFSNNTPGAGHEPAGEPSMEEILASIRRILKDEAGKGAAGNAADPEPRQDARMAPLPLPPRAEPDDDVLVLDSSMVAKPVDLSTATSPPPAPLPMTESPATPMQSTASPVHFASEPTLTSPSYAPPPAAPEPDVVLTPSIAEAEPVPEPPPFKPAGLSPPPVTPVFGGRPLSDFPVMRQEPSPAPSPFTAFVPESPPSPVKLPETLIAPTPAPIKQPPSETVMPENQDNFTPPASLVSDQVTAAAANSIGAMLRSMSAEKSVAISRQGVTIEDMVRDEIRPLLKSWLDTNLAGLVERVVRAEIEKVMERSTP